MNRTFWLHNFDTWTEQPINRYDVGQRCRGNIQIHRLTETGGLLVFVNPNAGEWRAVHFYLPGLPFRQAYETAWRIKRHLDRLQGIARKNIQRERQGGPDSQSQVI